jgi:nitroreductase/NAD-dependent dihydropyrimidine dehydrogenase PreA subunit
MIEDGTNETLALDGADRIGNGKLTLDVQEGTQQPGAQATEAAGATFEDLKDMLRPTGVHMGVMRADPDKCTSCGLCLENCPFKCWEMDEKEIPKMKEQYACFSCFNCKVACPVDAISIVETYHADGGFFDYGYPPYKMPLEPQDAEGKAAEWTEVEKTMMERRSVRNFKDDPVPEPLIRRVLEAGRFAPSAGNHQPWKFAVVTDKDLIRQLEETCHGMINMMHSAYMNDAMVMGLVQQLGEPTPAGVFDPRVQGGVGCIARKELPAYLDAPVVIFVAVNDKAASSELQAGICGQNMNLAAQALGLGFCWSGFGSMVENVPELKAMLGFDPPWRIATSIALGYPKFKQKGVVPREFRPVTWFRPGVGGPEVEE